jgi:hypothetical protein
MRHARLDARHSRQSGASAVAHFDDGVYNDLGDAVGCDNNWGDNEQLGKYIDYHHFRNYNQRINNGWFDNQWDDSQRNDHQRNDKRIDRDGHDRINLEHRSDPGCEHHDCRPGSAF